MPVNVPPARDGSPALPRLFMIQLGLAAACGWFGLVLYSGAPPAVAGLATLALLAGCPSLWRALLPALAAALFLMALLQWLLSSPVPGVSSLSAFAVAAIAVTGAGRLRSVMNAGQSRRHRG